MTDMCLRIDGLPQATKGSTLLPFQGERWDERHYPGRRFALPWAMCRLPFQGVFPRAMCSLPFQGVFPWTMSLFPFAFPFGLRPLVQGAFAEVNHPNANPTAEFNVNLLTAFSVIVRDDEQSYEESIHSVSLNATCAQLKADLNTDKKLLIISMYDTIAPISEIKLKPLLKPLYGEKSNTLLKDKVIYPLIKLGLMAQTHPETPRHPKQKYYLTELGKAMLLYLRDNE